MEPETTAEIKAMETEPADPATAARLAMEAAYKAFRKRANSENRRALDRTAAVYQLAQYAAQTTALEAEYRAGLLMESK